MPRSASFVNSLMVSTCTSAAVPYSSRPYPRRRNGPLVAIRGEEAVDQRDSSGQQEQRPDGRVVPPEGVLENEGQSGDHRRKDDARRAPIRSRLRIRDHEEREEDQAAHVELV